MQHPPTSLVDILRRRAKNQPHRLAYRYLMDGEFDEVVLTYGGLDRRARSIGALLQSCSKAGDRALLLFPPGLDFIAAYFGCLYAKIIAVPTYPPHHARLEKMLPIIRSIAANATPAVALMTSSLFDVITSENASMIEFGSMKMLVTDGDDIYDRTEQWQEPDIAGSDLAFLQYTSGSTNTPKGVMVSHNNLLHNLDLIEKCFGQSSESHAVIWLPPYHDMGLVGGILQPLYSGYPVTLMSHMLFLQQPFPWLQAISHFRATTSGAPNFAYDLCIRKIKPEKRTLLDLSCWEVAFNGAEQVYHKTLGQFTEFFSTCGFRRKAFLPCYGLAEATLLVTGGPKARSPVIQHMVSSGLEHNQAIISPTNKAGTRTLVSCGQNMFDQIRTINPETLMPCLSDQVGEIWVSGPSVACGYWNNPTETELTFGAWLSDSTEGPFLRTGDFGFMHEGELYVTGRLKNMIISDGNNHYSNDIERTVERCHPAIRPAGCAVFPINHAEGERLIVIAEVDHNRELKTEEVIKAIRQAVSVHHELAVHDIRLTTAGNIPKTFSGKIKHYLCKANYMAGIFNEMIYK